jgi:hypothetical protein
LQDIDFFQFLGLSTPKGTLAVLLLPLGFILEIRC